MGDLLAKLAQLVGLKASPAKQRAKLQGQLKAARVANYDRLEELKEEIRRTETIILRKKQEYQRAHGETKRIVAGEIQRLFTALDKTRGRQDILARNIDAQTAALNKLEELNVAQEHGMPEGALDDLALDLETSVADLERSDQALADLEKVGYKAKTRETPDLDSRLAEFDAPPTAEPEGLPADLQQRLKELEAADE